MNAAVLIPAYRPGAALIDLVRELGRRPFAAIVVVDDGSGPEFQQVFREAAALPNVHLRRHVTTLSCVADQVVAGCAAQPPLWDTGQLAALAGTLLGLPSRGDGLSGQSGPRCTSR